MARPGGKRSQSLGSFPSRMRLFADCNSPCHDQSRDVLATHVGRVRVALQASNSVCVGVPLVVTNHAR